MSVTIHTSAGRRGAGAIDCKVCGVPIHQHSGSPEWYDGHGDTDAVSLANTYPPHAHTPADEMGPVLGPFEYAELTYDTLRVNEGEILASWDAQRGDWVLSDLAREHAGEAYSDLTIAATREAAR